MTGNAFDHIRRISQEAMQFSRKWLTDPVVTGTSYGNFLMHNWGPPKSAPYFEPLQQNMHMNGLLCGRWAMSGYPTVTMGHRTAAALCATKMKPADAVEFVRCPWPAFVIRLPDGLMTIDDRGVLRNASCIAVTSLDPEQVNYVETFPQPKDQARWWFKVLAEAPAQPVWDVLPRDVPESFREGVALWGFNMATQYMAWEDGGASDAGYTRWETQDTQDSDSRSERMCRSLILATCLYLSGDPRERAQRLSEDGVTILERKSKQREGDELPQYTNYELRSSIKVNLHHAIREYIEKGGSAPSVQTLVAGHWKRVVYGVGRSQRRLQHIQPYWRGDLDAPVSMRAK